MILTKNGNLMKFASGAAVNAIIPPFDPYDPSTLESFTFRCRFNTSGTPVNNSPVWAGVKWKLTQVDTEGYIWDITNDRSDKTNMTRFLYNQDGLTEILCASTSGVTNLEWAFYNTSSLTRIALFDTSSVTNLSYAFQTPYGSSLTEIPLFDTHNVTNMKYAFRNQQALRYTPLFDTSSVTNMDYAFAGWYNAESGALALYQQASTQANPPSSHDGCFSNWGLYTESGRAELAQIPSSWGGTAS